MRAYIFNFKYNTKPTLKIVQKAVSERNDAKIIICCESKTEEAEAVSVYMRYGFSREQMTVLTVGNSEQEILHSVAMLLEEIKNVHVVSLDITEGSPNTQAVLLYTADYAERIFPELIIRDLYLEGEDIRVFRKINYIITRSSELKLSNPLEAIKRMLE